MSSTEKYGKALPDQVDRIASLTDAQLELLEDVRELYRERIVLERDYATKLQALGKKAADKRARKISTLVLGSEPTKSWDESTLQTSTVNVAYSELITSILNSAQDHINLSDGWNSRVVETLRATERRHEDAKKRQIAHFQKLLSDRDKSYAERVKTKQKYDDECAEVESYRQKQERSTDDKHAERAAKQLEQQQTDMLNSKNVYIISTAVANRVKAQFYEEDLPSLEDQFQDLQCQLLRKFSDILLEAQDLHNKHLDTLKSRVSAASAASKAVDPSRDQDLFIDHNIRAFVAPPDFQFEPCGIHYDTGEMSIEPAPKVYLQNRLSRCKQKSSELHTVIDAKRRDVEQLARLVDAYAKDSKLGNVEEVTDSYLDAHHQLASYVTSECSLVAEIEVISAALGGDEGEQSPHAFKSSSFSIPTQCSYCQSTIWGLSKQGKTCKACGISVHSKCEMKIAANCPGSKQAGGRTHTPSSSISLTPSALSRSDTRASSVSSAMSSTPSSFAQTDPSLSHEETYPAARVVFDFSPTSPFELSVSDGDLVQVIEEDDGSGWVKVADRTGGRGLVPASYIELTEDTAATAPDPPTRGPVSSQGSGQFVRAVYDYQAQGPDEITLKDGKLIELSAGLNGGQNYADGWWEGIDAMGKKGIFPSNYVEIVP
ncbi:hypothetical protein QCA50_007044 [Cerrena zonata]|uniref:Uncharacterized protein n=1 Tax=Cerrena zonata TaxID=2478898 RepID=A0AAW0GBV7_9APHY